MKNRAVEKAVSNVLTKVFARNRGFLVEQFGLDFAVIGLNCDHVVSIMCTELDAIYHSSCACA